MLRSITLAAVFKILVRIGVLYLVVGFCIAAAQSTQAIVIRSVTNSVDFLPGLPQKGSLASIFVTGLEGPPGVSYATQYPLTNKLNGVSVWINFIPAPILSLAFKDGFEQINIQVPWEGPRDPLYVEVFQNGIRGHTEDTQTSSFSVFFSDPQGYGIVQHASDYTLVSQNSPARPGEYLIAYGINLGPVNNTPNTGMRSPVDVLARSTSPGSPETGVCGMEDQIHIGTVVSTPTFVGLTPGAIGVYQANFQVPASTATGDLPLTFVRTLRENPLGPCRGSGLENTTAVRVSRSVLLPVR